MYQQTDQNFKINLIRSDTYRRLYYETASWGRLMCGKTASHIRNRKDLLRDDEQRIARSEYCKMKHKWDQTTNHMIAVADGKTSCLFHEFHVHIVTNFIRCPPAQFDLKRVDEFTLPYPNGFSAYQRGGPGRQIIPLGTRELRHRQKLNALERKLAGNKTANQAFIDENAKACDNESSLSMAIMQDAAFDESVHDGMSVH